MLCFCFIETVSPSIAYVILELTALQVALTHANAVSASRVQKLQVTVSLGPF